MKLCNFSKINKGQKGFTLIEVLIVLIIMGIIATGVSITIGQIYDANGRNTASAITTTDIESMVRWITSDVQGAQNVTVTNPSGFPITLNSVKWDGTTICITYNLQNDQLQRSYSENGGMPIISTIGTHLNSAETSCTINGAVNGVTAVSFNLKSTVEGYLLQSKTATFTVRLRSG